MDDKDAIKSWILKNILPSEIDLPTLPPTGTPLDASPRPTPEHMGKRLVDSIVTNPGLAKQFMPNFGTSAAAGDATRYEWDRQTGNLLRGHNLPTSGMVSPGNIDINKRPFVMNSDGSVSTEVSMSIGTDKGEVLIPQVINGKRVSEQEAIDHYSRTGEHLGIFKDVESANRYADALHNREKVRVSGRVEERLYANPEMGMENMLIGEVDPPGGKLINPLGKKFITQKGNIDIIPGIQKHIWDKVPGSTGRMRVVPGQHLGEQSKKFLTRIKNRTGKESTTGALRNNQKTGLSIDFCTDCAKRHGPHGACPYCYVEHARVWNKVLQEQGKRMPSSGARIGEYPYNNDIMYMPTQLVNDLNKNGGLRMFSLGDYRPELDYQNVSRVLADAKRRNLYIKAITKQEEFIKKFGDHPNLRANISVDLLPRQMSNAPTIDEAINLAAGRPNINVRGVALNHDQVHILGRDPRVSVITLYHGMSDPEKLIKLIKVQNPKLVQAVGEEALKREVSTWHNFSKKEVMEIAEKYPGRVCCQGGKCAADPTKCGFGLVGAGFILPGVMIPEEEKSD